MDATAIKINEKDNVATALTDLDAGSQVSIKTEEEVIVTLLKDAIPFGHKFAVKKISQGDTVIKYGEIIGCATRDIEIGEHAHIQNIESLRGRGDKKD